MNNKLVLLKSFWFITHSIHLFSPCTQTFHVFTTCTNSPYSVRLHPHFFSSVSLTFSHFLFSFPFTGILSIYNIMVLMSNTKLTSLSTISTGWYTAWWFIVFNFTWQLYNWQQPAQEYYYSIFFIILPSFLTSYR